MATIEERKTKSGETSYRVPPAKPLAPVQAAPVQPG